MRRLPGKFVDGISAQIDIFLNYCGHGQHEEHFIDQPGHLNRKILQDKCTRLWLELPRSLTAQLGGERNKQKKMTTTEYLPNLSKIRPNRRSHGHPQHQEIVPHVVQRNPLHYGPRGGQGERR